MATQHISIGASFPAQISDSRTVVEGNWVYVTSATGVDVSSMTISENVVEQTEQCFKNLESALLQAGSCLADLVRVTYVLANSSEFEQCGPVLRKYLEVAQPVEIMISSVLADPRMKIEIAAIAKTGALI